ncbi:hypothetical protein ACJMK2_023990 [Sinanodonta woodiana]|uniref:Uncharacterized protein n=1 Tax=Sinanodonta woodiana TaxID=1069815 RepID=A0ABD3T7Q3_SINWO
MSGRTKLSGAQQRNEKPKPLNRQESPENCADAFRNEDVIPKAKSGTKFIARGGQRAGLKNPCQMGSKCHALGSFILLTKKMHCLCCLLFPNSLSNVRSAFESPDGFSKWKKSEKVKHHEVNMHHRKSFIEWKEMERLLKLQRGIYEVLERKFQDEKLKWREILKRVIDIIKHLVSQSLALRGHVETLDSDSPGNCLATLKLVPSYDTVMAWHLRNTDILSMLANAVLDKIINEIKEAKYFDILFDSTPHISHTEQVAEVIPYVHFDFETRNAIVKETCIEFVELYPPKMQLAMQLLRSLEEDGLNFLDCTAQMYDNAAVMSGSISGVQTRLREKNPKAVFINCDNHSHNLAGVHAASVDPTLVTFFGTIQEVYVFFLASKIRCKKMSEKLELTVKKESDIRWSAREVAVRVIANSYDELIELLQYLNKDENEFADTRAKAGNLLKSLLSFDFVCFINFWSVILHKINRKNSEIELPSTPGALLKATIQYGKYVFPNLRTALKILLTMSVSVASCERSFSKLKLIKLYLRSTMGRERLSNLTILSIEKSILDSVDFDGIIDCFAETRTRKKNL